MKYKFNVRPENCRYIVNREKRKIICLIENTQSLFTDFAARNFDIPCDCMDYSYFKPTTSLEDKLRMPKRFWGVATCAEGDEWNEENGKLLAFSRAKDKLNKSFFKRANLYVRTFDRCIDRAAEILDNLGEKLSVNTVNRHNRLAELLGEDENGVSAN